MEITSTGLDGVFLITPKVFSDDRGFFMESWSEKELEANGLHYTFVQDNHSYSRKKGTLRGVHFQADPYSQAKLVRCIRGAVMDVAVDLRPSSPTYKMWVDVEFSGEIKKQLLIPRGFGHAFLTLTDDVEFLYKADNFYCPQADHSLRWDDPELAIEWGVEHPILSNKDAQAPLLHQLEYPLK